MFDDVLFSLILLILFFVVGFLIDAKLSLDKSWKGVFTGVFPLCLFLIWILLLAFTLYFDSETVTETSYEDKKNIISLSAHDEKLQSEDKFIIGLATEEWFGGENPVYVTVTGTSDKGYQTNHFYTKDVYLFFDEETNPHVQTRVETPIRKYNVNWLNGGLLKKLEDKTLHDEEVVSYEFHLPKSTIKKDYDLK